MSNYAVSVKPQYGLNYRDGFIGFTFDDSSFLSSGIVWFTSWEQGQNSDVPNIPVSHVFVVTGENQCVEAWVPKVRISSLSDYFNNPHKHVCFRKPNGMTDEIAQQIVKTSLSEVGKSYNYTLIIGHAISDSWVGRMFDSITGGKFHILVTSFFNTRWGFMCSQLASYCMNLISQYKGRGVLKDKVSSIDPQKLFQSKEIFEPWSITIKGDKV